MNILTGTNLWYHTSGTLGKVVEENEEYLSHVPGICYFNYLFQQAWSKVHEAASSWSPRRKSVPLPPLLFTTVENPLKLNPLQLASTHNYSQPPTFVASTNHGRRTCGCRGLTVSTHKTNPAGINTGLLRGRLCLVPYMLGFTQHSLILSNFHSFKKKLLRININRLGKKVKTEVAWGETGWPTTARNHGGTFSRWCGRECRVLKCTASGKEGFPHRWCGFWRKHHQSSPWGSNLRNTTGSLGESIWGLRAERTWKPERHTDENWWTVHSGEVCSQSGPNSHK